MLKYEIKESPEVELLKDKHKSCSTQWIGFHWSHVSGKSGFAITQNHCSDRSCPVCIKYRIAAAKIRMRPYFDCIEKPKHIVLTTPNMKLTKQNIAWFRMKLRSFYKRLSRSGARFFGVAVLEMKPAERGLYHIHVHIVSNLAPQHEKLTNIWSNIVGTRCSTRVRYRVNRSAVLNYFARRCAMAGIGVKLDHYIKFIKGTRLFSKFGSFPSYLEVLQITETNKRKEFTFTMLGSWKKDQNVSIPPDWLSESYLMQIYLEMC